jgi:hypothetical protein
MMRIHTFRAQSLALTGALLISGCLVAATVTKTFTATQRRWWAFQPVVKPPVPAVKNTALVKNPIDAFVLAKLEAKGLQPNPQASKITLLRRVSLDLTGLPPTPEEIQSFLSDDSRQAWEKVVDRLLASPHYGERYARHWLDLARYADSEGFKSDETRPNIWRYRDYVIDSLNADKGFDRFTKEQIAGDELYPGDPAALIATGFNRHFPDESNARNLMQRRQEQLNDITDTVAATFLGMTYGCARCHDHKFDPILHKDYYRLQAFFVNTRIKDDASLLKDPEREKWEAEYAEWDAKTKDIRAEMKKLTEPMVEAYYKENFDKFPEEIQAIYKMAPESRSPYQWQMYYKGQWTVTMHEEDAAKKLRGASAHRYAELTTELAQFDSIKPPTKPVAQAMVDNGVDCPKTFVLRAGAYDAPTEEVQPGFLSILDPTDANITPLEKSSGRRSVLANWLADPKNPLTTRVIVNRVWNWHFGQGISNTPSDFGLMGERPTDKELLDYLTATFIENGWSLKKLHKMIVMSNTYQESSEFQKASAETDPDNKYFWRWNRHRLEGESIRDSMLETAGILNSKMHGPGVFPPLPDGVSTRGGWKKDENPSEAVRRSVYVFVRRNTRYPMFQAFDMPDTNETCARRTATVTPTQSLELLNNDLVLDWAKDFAGRVLNDSGLSTAAEIDRAYKFAYGRTPSAEERRAAEAFLNRQMPILESRAAKSEKLVVPAKLSADVSPVKAAAFVDFCHMLFDSNEFLYID